MRLELPNYRSDLASCNSVLCEFIDLPTDRRVKGKFLMSVPLHGLVILKVRRCTRPQVLEPLNHVIKHGCQKDTEERDAEHAREHGGPEGAPHLGAGAFRYHERHHA